MSQCSLDASICAFSQLQQIQVFFQNHNLNAIIVQTKLTTP